MGKFDTNELLKDARLVVDYATRAGRLSGNALLKAIAAVEQAPAKGATQKIASLVAALNSAVRAIAPMTLVDLRAGRSPFDVRNQKATRRLQFFVCGLTFALTLAVAYYTQLLHQEDAALRALQEIQDAHPLDMVINARKMAQYETALEKHDSHYDEYRRAVGGLRDLQNKISSTVELAKFVDERASWPFGSKAGFTWPSTAAPYQPNDTSTATDTPKGSAAAAEMPKGSAAATESSEGTPAGSVKHDVCGPKSADDAVPYLTNPPTWLQRLIADSIDEFCFLINSDLGVNSFDLQGAANLTYQIRADMALLNGWLLPFLYGLLGASVYLMRSWLDPRTPNLGSGAAILRIALGGIAGIIIGWFWVPAASKSVDIATITAVPFGLAFLTGFSIDILFSLLDRLNRTVSDAPAQASHRSAQGRAPA